MRALPVPRFTCADVPQQRFHARGALGPARRAGAAPDRRAAAPAPQRLAATSASRGGPWAAPRWRDSSTR
jgi:hypothetical protein